ncbi:MAG: TolC family protein [Campylobacterales bacterium]|nr:TolC family protein [Campylobacterales bacterium]
MLRILLSSFLASSLLSAVTIDELVKNSFEKNYDLKSLNKSIKVADEQIKVSKNWENPMLAFKVNNIGLNKPLSNQKEYGVELSQVIPIGRTLDIEENIARKDRNIKQFDLEDKKLELESKIYEYSYNILILEKRYKLIENYLKNIEKLEELYSSLYKYQKASLNEVLNTKVSYLDLKLELDNLKTMIDNLYLNLELISYEKVESIDENVEIKEINKAFINQELIITHPKIKTLEEDSSKYKEMASLEEAKKYSNVTLSVEYMQNDEQDYGNVTVGIPLPLYKTENINALKAKLNSNETNDKLDSFIHNLSLQINIYLNNLNQSARNYKLIQKEIIPLKQKIQTNIENYNSFDMVKPEESIKNLNELITYETKALDEALKYYESYSQLIYFTNKGLK